MDILNLFLRNLETLIVFKIYNIHTYAGFFYLTVAFI